MRFPAFASLLLLITTASYAADIGGVPFVKQERGLCGPAALSSVMTYYGTAVGQDVIAKVVYSEKLKGTLISDLENYARSRHFKTTLGQGTIERLKQFIDQGKPVIVPVDMGFWIISQPHYLLVFGYNAEGVLAHTGDEPSQIISYSVLERQWNKTGRTFLAVYP